MIIYGSHFRHIRSETPEISLYEMMIGVICDESNKRVGDGISYNCTAKDDIKLDYYTYRLDSFSFSYPKPRYKK